MTHHSEEADKKLEESPEDCMKGALCDVIADLAFEGAVGGLLADQFVEETRALIKLWEGRAKTGMFFYNPIAKACEAIAFG